MRLHRAPTGPRCWTSSSHVTPHGCCRASTAARQRSSKETASHKELQRCAQGRTRPNCAARRAWPHRTLRVDHDNKTTIGGTTMDIRINAASPGLIASLVLAVTLAAPGSAGAQQDYPNKPITLVVPFPPGGTSDVVGRIFAEALSREIGQQVIVDNRGGAGGTIGSRYVASAAPDGYTLLLATSSTNGTNSAVYKNLPYDPVKDFTPVTQIIRVPGVIATTKGFPAKD